MLTGVSIALLVLVWLFHALVPLIAVTWGLHILNLVHVWIDERFLANDWNKKLFPGGGDDVPVPAWKSLWVDRVGVSVFLAILVAGRHFEPGWSWLPGWIDWNCCLFAALVFDAGSHHLLRDRREGFEGQPLRGRLTAMTMQLPAAFLIGFGVILVPLETLIPSFLVGIAPFAINLLLSRWAWLSSLRKIV